MLLKKRFGMSWPYSVANRFSLLCLLSRVLSQQESASASHLRSHFSLTLSPLTAAIRCDHCLSSGRNRVRHLEWLNNFHCFEEPEDPTRSAKKETINRSVISFCAAEDAVPKTRKFPNNDHHLLTQPCLNRQWWLATFVICRCFRWLIAVRRTPLRFDRSSSVKENTPKISPNWVV